MRVIGGYLKGQKILVPTDKSTRPLKDRVRESIFNIIEHSNNETINLKGAKILDLFAGTGSFGICLLYTSPSPRDRIASRMPSSA